MAKKLCVVGTGTEVGKTYVTGLLVKKLHDSGVQAAYYKAAMSGNVRDASGQILPGDALQVRHMSGIFQPVADMCPYVYGAPVSPHLAARLEGHPLDMQVVEAGFSRLMARYDYITVEGSGGIVCPLRDSDEGIVMLEDVIQKLALPCLLVADAGLGTINGVVLTISYLRARQIPVQGLIMNRFHPDNPMEVNNREMCTRLTGVPVLACVQPGDREIAMTAEALQALYR